jgi:uncharacterized protein YwlG (UPF0340 family)
MVAVDRTAAETTVEAGIMVVGTTVIADPVAVADPTVEAGLTVADTAIGN